LPLCSLHGDSMFTCLNEAGETLRVTPEKNGSVTCLSDFVEGMASRWMVDASYTNLHFCLLWPSLLLAVLSEGPHGHPHPTDSDKKDGLGEVRNAVAPDSSQTGSRCRYGSSTH